MKHAIHPFLSTGREESGIIIGMVEDGEATAYAIYKTRNVLDSPVRFESDPWEVVQAHRVAEVYGVSVIGVFHTHPVCPPKPSRLDVEGMKRWPLIWVIACKSGSEASIAAWRLDSDESIAKILVD